MVNRELPQVLKQCEWITCLPNRVSPRPCDTTTLHGPNENTQVFTRGVHKGCTHLVEVRMDIFVRNIFGRNAHFWPFKTGVPTSGTGDLRWSWGNSSRNQVYSKCNALESSRNHQRHFSCPWKNCLPRSRFFLPKKLGTATTDYTICLVDKKQTKWLHTFREFPHDGGYRVTLSWAIEDDSLAINPVLVPWLNHKLGRNWKREMSAVIQIMLQLIKGVT